MDFLLAFQPFWFCVNTLLHLKAVEAAFAGADFSSESNGHVPRLIVRRLATTPWMGAFQKLPAASCGSFTEKSVHPLQAVICFQHPRLLLPKGASGLKAEYGEPGTRRFDGGLAGGR